MDKLPVGSEALEAAYDEAIQRIEAQPSDHRILAERVISWITYARRPLSLKELQHGLAVESGTSRFDEDNITKSDEMTSGCASLVTCSEKSDAVGLVHYTTQKYFRQKPLSWMANGDTEIAVACLTYLSFDLFGTFLHLNDDDVQAILSKNVFLDYALHYWGSHARESSHNGREELVIAFLIDEAKVSYLSQALRAPDVYRFGRYILRTDISPVHLVAYHNLDNVLIPLLGLDYCPNAMDSQNLTPLPWAAALGHMTIAEHILEQSNVKLDSQDIYGSTPLHRAVGGGHEEVTRLLLQKNAEVDSKDNFRITLLHYAVDEGHEGVIRLLLQKKAEVDWKDFLDRTPLHRAADRGHEAVTRLLLEKNAKVDSKDYLGQTPLHKAANGGHEAVTRLL